MLGENEFHKIGHYIGNFSKCWSKLFKKAILAVSVVCPIHMHSKKKKKRKTFKDFFPVLARFHCKVWLTESACQDLLDYVKIILLAKSEVSNLPSNLVVRSYPENHRKCQATIHKQKSPRPKIVLAGKFKHRISIFCLHL